MDRSKYWNDRLSICAGPGWNDRIFLTNEDGIDRPANSSGSETASAKTAAVESSSAIKRAKSAS
jgi:hypothetical protein